MIIVSSFRKLILGLFKPSKQSIAGLFSVIVVIGVISLSFGESEEQQVDHPMVGASVGHSSDLRQTDSKRRSGSKDDTCIDSNECRDITTSFGDSEPVSIRIHAERIKLPPHPARIIEQYDTLAAMAREGNASAGYVLYQALDGCKSAYTSREEIDVAINNLYATRRVTRPDRPDRPLHIGDEDAKTFELFMENEFYRCEGVTEQQKEEESIERLTEAADAGFLPAMGDAGWIHFRNGDIERGLEYFEMAWGAGSVLAVEGLYEIYKHGGKGVDPDPTKAAAYAYLNHAINHALFPPETSGALSKQRIAEMDNIRDEALRGLSPFQADVAIKLAKELVITNNQCCVF